MVNILLSLVPLLCPHCGTPMRIIAFVMDPPTIERILRHIEQPHEPPAVLPARSPPQAEFAFNQGLGVDHWPDLDQAAGAADDPWD